MKIDVLIVDDDPFKVSAISDFLVENGILKCNIFVAGDAASARRALKGKYFDLMLLDVLLPTRKDQMPSGDVSVDFLREIVEDETSPSPGRIVAITSSNETLDQYQQDFRRLVTQLIHIEVGNDEWKHSVECLVGHLVASGASRNQYDFDLCIQATLRAPELSEVLSYKGIKWSPEELLSNGLVYNRGEWEVGGKVLKVACAHATQMGMVAASHLANKMIELLKPRLILMTGICGSVGSETKIGDLIVANKSWDWQAGKWDKHGNLQIAPDQKDASSALVPLAQNFEEHIDACYADFPGGKPSEIPRLLVAPMASGSAVVADADFHALFKRQHRKVDGIDMECYGFYHSAALADEPRPLYICIKAVSDRANETKVDDFQRYCSYLSAHAALHVAKKYLLAISN
jgi:nucleoside phosphorylase